MIGGFNLVAVDWLCAVSVILIVSSGVYVIYRAKPRLTAQLNDGAYFGKNWTYCGRDTPKSLDTTVNYGDWQIFGK